MHLGFCLRCRGLASTIAADWKAKAGGTVTVNQSRGSSSRQVLSVTARLEADVIAMNQPPSIDILAERGGLVTDWRQRFPHDATPYPTTSVFLVRKDNPEGIKDWDDLAKPGLQVVVPHPSTSGNGRYTCLAAWGYALGKSEDAARGFVTRLLADLPLRDGGGLAQPRRSRSAMQEMCW